MSEVIHSEVLVNLPDRKGVITKKEPLEALKEVQAFTVNAKKIRTV